MSPRNGTDGPHDDPQTHLDTDPVNRPDEGAATDAEADPEADNEEEGTA